MTALVGFVGMTHLGLVSATSYSDKGMKVYCFDRNQELIEQLKNGKLPVSEPDLDRLLTKNGDRQIFTSDFEELTKCDVVYISPDVPTDDAGQSDLSEISDLIEDVIPHLSDKANLVLLCQVPPGFTAKINFPKERLYYQVETLVFGCAVERASFPERYIIGVAKPEDGIKEPFLSVLNAFGCPLLPMRYESAEMAKISINMCLVSSISVANTLAELCEKIGADWSEIVPALKLDKRIGQYSYLKPGLGIAGGNLERDLATVINFSKDHETDCSVVEAWIKNSRHRGAWAARQLRAIMAELATEDVSIGVWGLAYKENTHSIKNSPSIATLEQFASKSFIAFDPKVKAAQLAGQNVIDATSELDAAEGKDILMILTPWPQFKDVDLKAVADVMVGKKIVLDPYRVFEPASIKQAGLSYRTLGAIY